MIKLNYSERDILSRLKAVLPPSWFGDVTPVLDSVLVGLAGGWQKIFALFNYANLQTRIATSNDFWLDFIARDFFGSRFSRRNGEPDEIFQKHLKYQLTRDYCTRHSIIEGVEAFSGATISVFEPTNPNDTGSYGGGGTSYPGMCGYGMAGRWGCDRLPFQIFILVDQAKPQGNATLSGWCERAGGYGVGDISYVSATTRDLLSTNSGILSCISETIAAGTVAWVMFK